MARTINNDPVVGDRLKVIFLPNYNVSLTEKIIPAADLSEQISTAGMEASGTGNMKLALNGALTIGTLDGANIEIRDLVGHDNMFIFGLTAEEVQLRRANGYQPRAEVEAAPALAAVYDAVSSGAFSPDDPGRFRPLIEQLLGHDYFMVSADFARYAATQRAVDAGVPRRRHLVAARGHQHRQGRLVLVRPHDPRLRERDLGRAAGPALRRSEAVGPAARSRRRHDVRSPVVAP